jgi:phosphoadenosine phosphosulfate reductase
LALRDTTGLSKQEAEKINRNLDGQSPQEVLTWAFAKYDPDIVLACSFGGTAGMVLLDMATKINPEVKVFFLDTDFLFPETYALRDEIIRRYAIQPLAFKSKFTPEEQAQEHGEALWLRDPDLCCQLRKVEPIKRALGGRKAWITGIRRDQSSTRHDIAILEWDNQFGLAKVNPMVNWSEAQVREYINEHNVPYNPLQDRGYTSIGCTHCTRPVTIGEDPRAGRWSAFDKTECGIHVTVETPRP